jgi:hypothetical protein
MIDTKKLIIKNIGHSPVVVADVVVVVFAANNQTNTYFYTFLRNKKDSYKTLHYSIYCKSE